MFLSSFFSIQNHKFTTSFLFFNSLLWIVSLALHFVLADSWLFYPLIILLSYLSFISSVSLAKQVNLPFYPYLLSLLMVLSAILGQTLSITWLILGFTISAVSWRFALGKLSTASQSTNVNEHKADVLNMRPRIEPSFGKLDRAPLLEIQNSEQLTQETNEGKQNFHQTDANKSYKSSTDELYKTWQTYKENLVIYLKRHPKLIVLAIFGVTSILLATTVINSHKKTKNIIPPALPQQLVEIKPIPVEQQSKLDFKGDFSLGMVDRQPVISWQQKSIIQGDKWSLATAKGDTSCSELIFNNGDKLRPMKVIAVDGNTYQAWFSPLDSEKLIQNLAALSNAKLCGHKFPLTGTLRILSKTQPYADYL